MNSLIEQLASDISASLFLDEFCFDRNTFKRAAGQIVELADLVLWLGPSVLLVQVKERDATGSKDEEAMRRWFRDRVMADGVGQIRDTHAFLTDHKDKSVANRRDDRFPIATFAQANKTNIILIGGFESLPPDLERHKLIVDANVGAIHIVKVESFLGLFSVMGTPGELTSYFQFRELHLRAVPDHERESEKWLFGRYVASPEVVDVSLDTQEQDLEEFVNRMIDDSESVDIRPYLRDIRTTMYARLGPENGYYAMLMEIGLLPRSMMREFKRRLVLCLENVMNGVIKLPYRIANPRRETVFLFSMSRQSDLEQRQNELFNLTLLAKYDSKAIRALGCVVADLGGSIGHVLDWCWAEMPWERDEKSEELLKSISPFRPLREEISYGFFTSDN